MWMSIFFVECPALRSMVGGFQKEGSTYMYLQEMVCIIFKSLIINTKILTEG